MAGISINASTAIEIPTKQFDQGEDAGPWVESMYAGISDILSMGADIRSQQ